MIRDFIFSFIKKCCLL